MVNPNSLMPYHTTLGRAAVPIHVLRSRRRHWEGMQRGWSMRSTSQSVQASTRRGTAGRSWTPAGRPVLDRPICRRASSK